jgi:hypothetical protein
MSAYNTPFAFMASGAAGAEQSLTSAADIHTWVIPFKCVVRRVAFTVGSDTVSTGNIVVDFDRTPKSDGTRESAFETLTIPTGIATGTVYYADVGSNKFLYEGDLVTVQVSTAAAGGSAAGGGRAWMIVDVVPEVAGNNTDMTESA